MNYSLQENVSLQPYTTFGVESFAKRFISVDTESQLLSVLQDFKEENLFFLGGGSNILFTRDIEELVVHINVKGIDIIEDKEDSLQVRVSAGEDWHDFVLWSLKTGLSGIENLSLIPGNVGTAPIQNIGAYGVEIKDVCVRVKCIERETGKIVFFSNDDCRFGYRDSVFKQNKNKYVITAVIFELSKLKIVNTSYGAIQKMLTEKNIETPNPHDVSDAVIAIRSSKLPDPKDIGSAGSFFKNPVITKKKRNKLLLKYPDMPHYEVLEGMTYKIPAGWLIDTLGWKGKTFENYGVHKDQALVLVNYGGAKGSDIWSLAQDILTSVEKEFSIKLEPEVNVY